MIIDFKISSFLFQDFFGEKKQMGSIKSVSLKRKLAKAIKRNRRVPLFALAKTRKKAQASAPRRRNWRRDKLGLTKK